MYVCWWVEPGPEDLTVKSRWIVMVMLTFKAIALVYHGERNIATFKYRCCVLQLKGEHMIRDYC